MIPEVLAKNKIEFDPIESLYSPIRGFIGSDLNPEREVPHMYDISNKQDIFDELRGRALIGDVKAKEEIAGLALYSFDKNIRFSSVKFLCDVRDQGVSVNLSEVLTEKLGSAMQFIEQVEPENKEYFSGMMEWIPLVCDAIEIADEASMEVLRFILDEDYQFELSHQIASDLVEEILISAGEVDQTFLESLSMLLKSEVLCSIRDIELDLDAFNIEPTINRINLLKDEVRNRIEILNIKHRMIDEELCLPIGSRHINTSRYLPTLGLEIQPTRLSSMHGIRDYLGKEKFPVKYTYLGRSDAQRSARFLGCLPSDDQFFEFSLQPSRSETLQSRTLMNLEYLGFFVGPRYVRLPGISVQPNLGGGEYGVRAKQVTDMSLVGRYRELSKLQLYLAATGISSHNEALNNLEATGWYVKGITGDRSYNAAGRKDVIGNNAVAEARLIEHVGRFDILKTIKIVRRLGAAIMAYQIPEQERDTIQRQLALVWVDIERRVDRMMRDEWIDLGDEFDQQSATRFRRRLEELGEVSSLSLGDYREFSSIYDSLRIEARAGRDTKTIRNDLAKDLERITDISIDTDGGIIRFTNEFSKRLPEVAGKLTELTDKRADDPDAEILRGIIYSVKGMLDFLDDNYKNMKKAMNLTEGRWDFDRFELFLNRQFSKDIYGELLDGYFRVGEILGLKDGAVRNN